MERVGDHQGMAGSRPRARGRGGALAPSHTTGVTPATPSPGADVTHRHPAASPHPPTHPGLLHAEKSRPRRRGERSQGGFVCTGSGKYSSTESLPKATLLHKHKQHNPRLVKKLLPVFTPPARRSREPHAVQPCTFWQGYKKK